MSAAPTEDPLDGWSLPSWCYDDPDFHAAERERVFATSWQVVCHASDIPGTGDWRALEFIGESILVIRGEHGELRAFSNVCRHRGARILDGTGGCTKRLVCPYHGWTYGLDGHLMGVPQRADYSGLDMKKLGLAPVDLADWHGFLFVRLVPGGPDVAQMMAPHEAGIAAYGFERLLALGRVTLRPREVDWKNVADNYSDGMHVGIAHPGLTRLFGTSYGVEAGPHVDRMWGTLTEQPSLNWSERAYQRLLPRSTDLAPAQQRSWMYLKLWPNVAFDIYPDQVDFMQFLPVAPGRTLIREVSYALPDERREMRAARYLNWRINRRVNAEDTALVTRVQRGMASRTFSMGPLGSSEVCLRAFCRRMRALIPQARQTARPAAGWSRS